LYSLQVIKFRLFLVIVDSILIRILI